MAVISRILAIRPCLRGPWPGGILDQVVELLARSAGRRPVDNIAFRTDTATGAGNLATVFRQMLQNPGNMTEEKANDQVKQTLATEIERTLR